MTEPDAPALDIPLTEPDALASAGGEEDSEEELDDAPSESEALGLLQRVQAAGALQGFDLKQARAHRISWQDLRSPLRALRGRARSYKFSRAKPSS